MLTVSLYLLFIIIAGPLCSLFIPSIISHYGQTQTVNDLFPSLYKFDLIAIIIWHRS
jgi:hypothetical protein